MGGVGGGLGGADVVAWAGETVGGGAGRVSCVGGFGGGGVGGGVCVEVVGWLVLLKVRVVKSFCFLLLFHHGARVV